MVSEGAEEARGSLNLAHGVSHVFSVVNVRVELDDCPYSILEVRLDFINDHWYVGVSSSCMVGSMHLPVFQSVCVLPIRKFPLPPLLFEHARPINAQQYLPPHSLQLHPAPEYTRTRPLANRDAKKNDAPPATPVQASKKMKPADGSGEARVKSMGSPVAETPTSSKKKKKRKSTGGGGGTAVGLEQQGSSASSATKKSKKKKTALAT